MNSEEQNKEELVTLETPMKDIEQKILEETDLDQLKSIINIFNLNIQKKNIVRQHKLSSLQDKISDQIEKRIEKNSDAFSNKDLLEYFKTIQETISKQDNTLNSIDIPSIQINQNQVNINLREENMLNRESRSKIADAIRSILNKQNSDTPLEVHYEEVQEEQQENLTIYDKLQETK